MIGRFAAVLALMTAGAMAFALPALGHHVSGATYEGTHDDSGDIQLVVTADGTGISSFLATSISADTCDFFQLGESFEPPIPIVDHAFSHESDIGLSITGKFPAPGKAEGTLRARQAGVPPSIPPCDSGDIEWSAEAPVPTASPTPSPTPTSSPSPTPSVFVQGDADCDGDVDEDDVFAILHSASGLEGFGACPVAAGVVQGIELRDVNCDLAIDGLDALHVLLFVADLPQLPLPTGCPLVGEPNRLTLRLRVDVRKHLLLCFGRFLEV